MKLRKLSIKSNINGFSGAEKSDTGYRISAGLPAFFSFSAFYATSSGYIVKIKNCTKTSAVFGILISSHTDSFVKHAILAAEQTIDIYIPHVVGATQLEILPQHGEIEFQDISLITYEQPKTIRQCNSALYVKAQSNPQGAIKFSKDGINIITPKGIRVSADLLLLMALSDTDVVTATINSPTGLKLLNEFGLYDHVTGQVKLKLDKQYFKPPIFIIQTNPEILHNTVSSINIEIGSYYVSRLEEYLNG